MLFFFQIWVPLSKLTELHYYSNSSIYEQMPSAYFWEREEWSVISVLILSENLDIFQQVKVPNGRCQNVLASHVVLEGTAGKAAAACGHVRATQKLLREHILKRANLRLVNQSSARCHSQNKAAVPRLAPEKHSTQGSHKKGK